MVSSVWFIIFHAHPWGSTCKPTQVICTVVALCIPPFHSELVLLFQNYIFVCYGAPYSCHLVLVLHPCCLWLSCFCFPFLDQTATEAYSLLVSLHWNSFSCLPETLISFFKIKSESWSRASRNSCFLYLLFTSSPPSLTWLLPFSFHHLSRLRL